MATWVYFTAENKVIVEYLGKLFLMSDSFSWKSKE